MLFSYIPYDDILRFVAGNSLEGLRDYAYS